MKKRKWSLFILSVLLISMFQMNVLAMDLSERAGINVCGTEITSENANDVLGDGSVSYDIENDILTLKNASISVDVEGSDGIDTAGDLTIVLEGKNTIVSAAGCSIDVDGNLTIKGEGSLEARGAVFGIYSGGNLIIGGNADVAVKVDFGDTTCYGMYSYSNMTIGENAGVTVEMIASPKTSYGIYSYDNLTICDNAKVTAIGGYGSERSCGIYAISALTISGDAVVNTTGCDNNTSDNAYNVSYGIRTTDLIVEGGSLTATGGQSNAASHGIFAQNLKISDGTVTTTGGTAYKGPSSGMEATASLTISGGTVKAVGGDAGDDKSCGIRSAYTMTVTGGCIYAESGNAKYSYSIESNDLEMGDGRVIANTADGSEYARGIQIANLLTISDGILDISSGDAVTSSCGLQSGKADIIGGRVIISSGNANTSSGIWAFESVNIADSTVKITSGGDGIYVPFGSVNIDCTEDTANKNMPVLTGTMVKIRAEGDYGIYAGTGLTLSERLNISEPLEVTDGEESYWTIGDKKGNAAKNITIYVKWQNESVSKVYEAFTALHDALTRGDLETLKAAVEEFSDIIDIFNGLCEEELNALALVMDVEDGEAAFNLVLSDWNNANAIITDSDKVNEDAETGTDTSAENDSKEDKKDETAATEETSTAGEASITGESSATEKTPTAGKTSTTEESTTTGKTVKTGDSSNLWFWLTISVVCGAVLLAGSVKKFRK